MYKVPLDPVPKNDTSKEMAELNDDNFINKQGVNSISTITQDTIKKPFIQTFKQKLSFVTKLEEKYARKLQARNIVEVGISENSNNPSTSSTPSNQLTPDVLVNTKKANRELPTYTVARDKVWPNMNDPMSQQDLGYPKTFPKGIPKSFLSNQEQFCAIQPQKDFASNPARWDIQMMPTTQNVPEFQSQMCTQTFNTNVVVQHQTYSPTEMYGDLHQKEDEREESPEILESGQKRQSAFERLGPAQPKQPKLTINLSLDQDVREVVEMKIVPLHEDENILNSSDETVIRYLPSWPWKNRVITRKTVTARVSKTVMMMEQEQMLESYDKDNTFILISVTGYPPTWKKEDVLDMILEKLAGKSFVPCFIDFNPQECRFFVIRCRGALLMIHWLGFKIRKDNVEIQITISTTTTSTNKLDFSPRTVLKRRLAMNYDGERHLDLSEFTLKYDISHFLYFPLNRICNQDEVVRIQSDVFWEYLTELNLSRNRITSIEGFNLETIAPNLRSLDLSHNYMDSIKPLLTCRQLPLKRLKLEGNPLCTDYTDPDHYVRVLRTIFPTLRELDEIPIVLKGDFPKFQKNYCPENAKDVVERFLEVFFPLLELPQEERKSVHSMYSEKAVMTITCRSSIRYEPNFINARNLLLNSRVLLEAEYDEVRGASAIAKLWTRWPNLQHDPSTFTIDVMFHNDSSTILRISGMLKLTAESLADDETFLAFTRTLHLHTKNGYEYKISNEMLYWDVPTDESSNRAFQQLTVPKKRIFDIKFESIPDDNTKKVLVKLFMKITELEELPSERCLEANDWHMKHALEYFMKLLKKNNIQCLMK